MMGERLKPVDDHKMKQATTEIISDDYSFSCDYQPSLFEQKHLCTRGEKMKEFSDGNLSVKPPNPNGTGLTLSWHNLSVWVRKKNEEKSTWFSTRYYDAKILRKVSGIAGPGTLMAIMGPSGAGKTTLLATISQRLKGDVKGKILVNGKQISKELMLKISGFVPQQDLTLDCLTVIEHLQIMARLKMDRFIKATQRTQRILAIISELGIVRCTNVRISALSGGERKRVALAVQMLNDPAILFCDEPTTGLDSYTASSVIEQLRHLAGKGKAVICTIHQPASGLFDMFHSVYLLIGGGKLALTCTTNETSVFFNNMGMVCPPTYNLAEFLVSQLAVGDGAESIIRVNKICTAFKMSRHYEHLLKKLDSELTYGKQTFITDITNSPYDSICQPKNDFDKYLTIQPPKRITQLYWLMWRSILDIIRNPQDQIIRLAFYLFMGLLISTPYIGLTVDQEGIQNLQGFLYLIIVETTFTYSYSVIHTFPSEIPILLREVGNGLYTPGAYYISKMIILLPRALFEPIIYSALVFWIPGLWGGLAGFIQFCIPVIACSIVATAYGCVISAIFENISTGSLLSVPFEQICLLFCGIYMSLSDVPFHFAWVKYVSVFYYGLEAVSILQWTQVEKIPCSSKPEVPCIRTGEGVLKYYGYSEHNFCLDMLGLMAIYCFCHFIGFIAFWNRSKKQAAY